MNTQKARLAQFFAQNAKTPIHTTQVNEIAGSPDGTRRLRELRSEGWSFRTQREGSDWSYTLTRVPAKRVVAQYV